MSKKTYYCHECGGEAGTRTQSWQSDVTGQTGEKHTCSECGSTVGISIGR